MKKIILNTLVIVITVWSCSKKEDTEGTQQNSQSNKLRDLSLELNIFDNKDQDLLDSMTMNYYDFNKMKLYYINDGQKEEVYDANMDLPRNIGLLTSVKPYVLGMSLSYHVDTIIGQKDGFEVGRSITYLELNKSTIDTIVSEWNRKSGYFVVQKIWYNGDYHELNGEPYQVKKDIN